MIKRIFDIIITLVLILCLFPLFMLAILIVFFNDGTPVLYKQERIGLNGRFFNLLKFRTMKIGAEKDGTTTYKDDHRIFFGGKILRRYKIDELPQLINVLKGEMSLVGPRPTVLTDYNKMTSNQKKRNEILPGLTGLAQISGNTSLKWPDRIKLDLYYSNNKNILLDIKIIFGTFCKILTNTVDNESIDLNEWE